MLLEEFNEPCEQLRPIISEGCIISKLKSFQIAQSWSKMFHTVVINFHSFSGLKILVCNSIHGLLLYSRSCSITFLKWLRVLSKNLNKVIRVVDFGVWIGGCYSLLVYIVGHYVFHRIFTHYNFIIVLYQSTACGASSIDLV